MAERRLGRLLTLLLATTAAVTASNVYLNQPLLGAVAAEFGVASSVLGVVPTATQLGYALGILLVVPLGDTRQRRGLIVGLGTLSALTLALAAVAPNVGWLTVASFLVGFASPVPQIIMPLAVALSGGARNGRIVGLIQSGLLVGVLASRTYSGVVAEAWGWRSVYWCSVALTLLITVLVGRALPGEPPTITIGYRSVLGELPALARRPLVWRITVSGACVGVAFGAFWTTLTFLLEDSYGYGSAVVGLFGLVATLSALASPLAGRVGDRLGYRWALIVLTAIALAGWLVLLPGSTSLAWLIAGVIVLDVGVWGNQVVCQSALFTLEPAVHSRLNTLYFTQRFAGIALGSLAGSLAWAAGGWAAVAALGVATSALGLLIGSVRRRGGCTALEVPPVARTPPVWGQ